MMHSAATRTCCLVLLLFLFALPASAATVNVDIERSGDATHSGSDGALSAAGTIWNSVLAGTDAAGLVDDAGAPTAVGLAFPSTMFESPVPFGDAASTNDLQDSGVLGPEIDILNLDPAATYSLAVYGNVGGVVDGGGSAGACSRTTPTYVLPGTEGADYCLYTGLVPFEVQPGVYGIQLTGPVMVAGLQLVGGSSAPPDPPADTTPPECSMLAGSPGANTIQVSLVDTESGITAIHVTVADNVTVTVPAFTPGTTDPVVVTASSDDAANAGTLELESEDTAGNSGVCNFQIAGSDPPPPPAEGCDAMIAVFDQAVHDGRVTGLGSGNSAKGRLGAFRHMLVEACALYDADQLQDACDMLAAAARKCDGAPNPPDFITGEGTADVMAAIAASPVADACWSSTQSMLQSSSVPDPAIPVSWGLLKVLYDE